MVTKMPPSAAENAPFEKSQWPFWLIFFGVFGFLMYAFSPIILPFAMGMVIAYFMDPVVDRLEARRVPRWAGTTIALTLFVVFIALLILLLLPMIQAQVEALLAALPGYISKIQETVIPWAERNLRSIDPQAVTKLRNSIGDIAGQALNMTGTILQRMLSGGMALFDLLSLLIITPIVAFYFLRDWDNIVAQIDSVLPKRHAKTIHAEAHKIDDTLSGFLHGQALVCLTLGTYYAFALTLVGLDFGATIGIVVGVLSFIPYVGTILGFVCSTGLALIQFDNTTDVMIVIGIYVLGQLLEGNVISPKLVGDRIGLHPVWIIFALMAGGSLFGFLGVLVALPVAAILGVLIRFALEQYKHSRYYLRR